MVSWYLGKTTMLEGVAYRGLDGMKGSEGKRLRNGERIRQEGPLPSFPLPSLAFWTWHKVYNWYLILGISVGSFGFSSIEEMELVAIKIKRESSSRSVQGQSKSPDYLAAHLLLPLPWEGLGSNPWTLAGQQMPSQRPPRSAFTEDHGGSPREPPYHSTNHHTPAGSPPLAPHGPPVTGWTPSLHGLVWTPATYSATQLSTIFFNDEGPRGVAEIETC